MKCLVVGVLGLMCVASSFAMPTSTEQKNAEPKVLKIMAGFKGFGEAEQAGMAMKASEATKSEAEKFLLLQGAFRKYLKVKDYAKAASALDKLNASIADVPESYLREQLEKALKAVPVGEGAELKEIQDALDESRPRILSFCPANGDMQVDSSVKEIVVRFDRPMNGGRSVCGKLCPRFAGKPSFDDSMKVLTMPVVLEKGKIYLMSFNAGKHMNFKSKEGVTLKPVPYTFGVK